MIRFNDAARRVVGEAQVEARVASSKTMEAEHVLVALSNQRGSDAQKILAAEGLDPGGLRGAVAEEFESSLASIGVSIEGLNLQATGAKRRGRMQWGTSTRQVFERAVHAAQRRGDTRMGTTHLLVGVLGAKAGTVPRVLAAAGADIESLLQQTEKALGQ
jgi:ATP-dependent Clp protease ATP-binding subunit ClpA